MSQYKYKFVKGKDVIKSIGYNLYNGAENAGIRITRCNRLSKWYLQSTKFEDRIRNVWGIKQGEMSSDLYEVHQAYNI